MRILIVSNAPWANTGYGTQTSQLALHLRDAGYEVAIFANFGLGGSKTEWNGIRVYPTALDLNGNEMLHGHANDWQADLVIILYDAFVMRGEILRRMPQQVCIWQPVDCEWMSRGDLSVFRTSGVQPIAMAQFGVRMMRNEGLDPLYAPHGIDTEIVFVPPEWQVREQLGSAVQLSSREQARGLLRAEAGVPEDAFVIGMNVHNKDAERKAVWEQMSAFAIFHQRHPDSLLYLHTLPHPVMSGNDLIGMADYLGIAKACHWADPYSLLAGNYTPTNMASWYARLNLYSGAARGEGFGIPLIEAQACGVPVVTTDCSAMTENVGPGYLVSGQVTWQRGHGATWVTPDIGELVDAYEDAYDGGAASRSEDARKFAMEFNADLVFSKHWVPVLNKVEGALAENVQIAPAPVAGEWKKVR